MIPARHFAIASDIIGAMPARFGGFFQDARPQCRGPIKSRTSFVISKASNTPTRPR